MEVISAKEIKRESVGLLRRLSSLKRRVMLRALMGPRRTEFLRTAEGFLRRLRGKTLSREEKRTLEKALEELQEELRTLSGKTERSWHRTMGHRNSLAGRLMRLGIPLEDLREFMTEREWREAAFLRERLFTLNVGLAYRVLRSRNLGNDADLEQEALMVLFLTLSRIAPGREAAYPLYVQTAIRRRLERLLTAVQESRHREISLEEVRGNGEEFPEDRRREFQDTRWEGESALLRKERKRGALKSVPATPC